jgi:RimJ/RimL family protein N-acetyltransferase
MDIIFERANLNHKDIIFKWLDSEHVKEYWDNSFEHRQDILIFINGRKELSSYLNGTANYWVGSINSEPYCFLLTTEFSPNEKDAPMLWKKHASKSGKTITIDFCIGNQDYLGRGFASKTLIAFTKFFHFKIDPKADIFYIDPDENNPRAKHVYEKAGFNLVGDFIMNNGVFSGQKTSLMVKGI